MQDFIDTCMRIMGIRVPMIKRRVYLIYLNDRAITHTHAYIIRARSL